MDLATLHRDSNATGNAEGVGSRLVDRFGRVHTSLRVSVTDRCNLRCFYCMPDESIRFRPREEILSFEEITRVVAVAAQLGVERIRLTGGEPLVRQELDQLVRQLVRVQGIREVSLTTNGILLAEQAAALKAAGLSRLNVSLDTLREEAFEQIARRHGLQRVLYGIHAAKSAGFERIRINAVPIRGLSEVDVIPLMEFATELGLELRFIEFMPLDAEQNWTGERLIRGEDLKRLLEARFGALRVAPRSNISQPSVDYLLPNGATVGFINPVTEPFCESCNRLRLTAEGQLRSCLFSAEEWNLRDLVRGGANAHEIAAMWQDCVFAKKAGHGIDAPNFQRPQRAMYQIGG